MAASKQLWPGQLPDAGPPDPNRRMSLRDRPSVAVVIGCVLLVGIGVLTMGVGYAAYSAGARELAAPVEIRTGTATVLYEVTATAGSAHSIAYVGGDNSLQMEVAVVLPWSKRVVNTAATPITGLNVQRNGFGDITCRITVNGRIKAEQTASGLYAVVNCNASG
ncbi:MmpS family transport accessory protein [Nocardia sp. NPDC050710]|uniref:MmpS family transport accessory protein n=1 Tax=Nocardia sp. NPDC050710 TaxID=3157220 RepID=UPI0034093F97